MRIFMDTEFIEDGRTIDLISIGMVREDGAELYLENIECNLTKASEWVAENVIPHLQGGDVRLWRAGIAARIVEFVGEKPTFIGYYADYDWVVLCQLYGTMMQLPKGWPKFCFDLKQMCESLGNPNLPEQGKGEHHALEDAKWTRDAYDFLMKAWNAPDPSADFRSAIADCARQFRDYERQHLAKTPPDTVKAETNATFAAMCEGLLGQSTPQ